MQILLDVSVHVPLSVGHRLFDLRLGSNDYLPLCCERADTVEFALQTLYFEENGDVRQRRLCHIVLTAGALRPCCTWPRRGLVAGPGPRTDQQSERRDGAVSTDIQHNLCTHKRSLRLSRNRQDLAGVLGTINSAVELQHAGRG